MKICGYFPYTGQIYLNGHEYAKRQCLKAGIAFTSLDNAFGSASDPTGQHLRRPTDQKIYRFARQVAGPLAAPVTRRGRPLLRERGAELSASQVYRLVTDKPERLSMCSATSSGLARG